MKELRKQKVIIDRDDLEEIISSLQADNISEAKNKIITPVY